MVNNYEHIINFYFMDKNNGYYEDDDIEEYLDTEWIEHSRQQEIEYNKYYVTPLKKVNIYFLFIDGDNLDRCEHRSIYMDVPNVLSWEEMLPLVNGYISQGYCMSKRLKYSMTASPEEILEGKWDSSSSWHDVGVSSDIYFGDMTGFMHEIACVVCIMLKRNYRVLSGNRCNNTTRRIYMDLDGGRNRSLRNKTRKNQ